MDIRTNPPGMRGRILGGREAHHLGRLTASPRCFGGFRAPSASAAQPMTAVNAHWISAGLLAGRAWV